jgi:hypothetical protein
MPLAIIYVTMKSFQDWHFNICSYACIILCKATIKIKLISWGRSIIIHTIEGWKSGKKKTLNYKKSAAGNQ